jgi:uncharacterized YccA/Bax inhibitor family protein
MRSAVRSSNPAWRGAGFQTIDPMAAHDVTVSSADAPMTMEDVIVHTLGVFLLAAVAAGFGWIAITKSVGPVGLAGFVAFALSFAIGYSRVVRPALVVIFAALEGFALGGVSHIYASTRGSGIVAQALMGTAIVFVVMLVLHRSGRLRATPRMTKIVTAVIFGVIALSVINFVMLSFGSGGISVFNPSNGSTVSILFSLGVLVVASLMFTLDFAAIEAAIERGAPRREAWRAAYGLLVAFVWVYLELLRLLSKLNSR